MLHNNVRAHRTALELTQTDLGVLVGVTRQTVAFIEKGEFSPSVTLALKLAKALNVSVADLFWLEEEEA